MVRGRVFLCIRGGEDGVGRVVSRAGTESKFSMQCCEVWNKFPSFRIFFPEYITVLINLGNNPSLLFKKIL